MARWRHECGESWEQYRERAVKDAAASEAFWNRPEEEIWRDLVVPEEDLPPSQRGHPNRQFRSKNVADLVAIRKARAKA